MVFRADTSELVGYQKLPFYKWIALSQRLKVGSTHPHQVFLQERGHQESHGDTFWPSGSHLHSASVQQSDFWQVSSLPSFLVSPSKKENDKPEPFGSRDAAARLKHFRGAPHLCLSGQ